MVSSTLRQEGYSGGEGCQVLRLTAISNTNPNFVLFSTDVGGIYRSLDGGDSWHPAMVGWWSRAGTGFAIDPVNASHVLGLGGNGGAGFSTFNGMHVSWDMASSWNRTHPMDDPVVALDGPAVAFDPTSCSGPQGYCTRAYWSSSQGLHVTQDGGLTWTLANTNMSSCVVQVDENGTVFAASNDYRSFGMYKSVDQGATPVKLNSDYTLGLDIPDGKTLYVSNWIGVQASTDQGASFSTLGQWGRNGLPTNTPIHQVCVSPANTSHMSVYWVINQFWNVTKAVSNDGGNSWQIVQFNNTGAFMQWSGRGSACSWHPTDPMVQFNNGGDWPTKSTDGGKTLAYSGNGYNAVMVGGSFNFNYLTPSFLMLAFQDYSGSFTATADAPASAMNWTWFDVPGGQPYGYDYGGFGGPNAMWAGDAPGWGGPRQLAVSFNNGTSFTKPKNATGGYYLYQGADVSYGSPVTAAIGFASNWRTADGGVTWANMTGCTSVHTHDMSPAAAKNPTLYGIDQHQHNVVASSDQGATWAPLFPFPGAVQNNVVDVAYDWQAKAMYVAGYGGLQKCTATGAAGAWTCSAVSTIPADQYNATGVTSVAVDPVNPSIVYVGQKKDIYLAWNAVARSTDGGATWDNLVLDTPLGTAPNAPLQGAHEVSWVRVHPTTRYLWAAGECYGFWVAPPPAGM